MQQSMLARWGAVVCLLTFTTITFAQERTSDAAVIKKTRAAQEIQTKAFLLMGGENKQKWQVIAMLKRCGNSGLASAVSATGQGKKDAIMKKILESPEVAAGVLTPEETMVALAGADIAMAAYMMGVDDMSRGIVATNQKTGFCDAAVKVADQLLAEK